MSEAAGKAQRKHAPAQERRAQILTAALECFSEKGYHAARMDDLVQASGLSKGSLYWHFKSKQDVFLALYDAFEAELFSAWQREAERTQSVLQLLRRLGEISVEKLGHERLFINAWAEFFTHPEARERLSESYRRSRAQLSSWIRRGIDAGEIRALPVDSVATLVTGAIEGMLLQLLVDPDFDLAAVFPGAWDTVERGLASA